MLKEIKLLTLKSLKLTGAFALVKNSDWRRQRLLILAYHGISLEDEDKWDPELFMHPEMFRARMQLIKKSGCTVLPLGEALQRLYAADLPPKCVAITFDDGNYDFYKNAYPILKEFDFPVTLYLSTFYNYYSKPVFDTVCSYLIWKGREMSLDLEKVTGKRLRLDLGMRAARDQARGEIMEFARREKLSAEAKDELAAKLALQLGIDYDLLLSKRILQQVNPHEIKQLRAGGVDLQLHTHRHRVPKERQLFYREIEDNRKSILDIAGSPTSHFCYPSGVYDQAFLPWLKDLEIVSATTCNPGIASQSSEQLLLPRFIDTSLQTPLEFEGWLAGITALLPSRNGVKR